MVILGHTHPSLAPTDLGRLSDEEASLRDLIASFNYRSGRVGRLAVGTNSWSEKSLSVFGSLLSGIPAYVSFSSFDPCSKLLNQSQIAVER
ncbi:hypothetical protein TNCV_4486391 [Trichonephila clavipes]|nr:hypothetical protein TNCV_4486391 [Trichonephila clavipes]